MIYVTKHHIAVATLLLAGCLFVQQSVSAQPFGVGVFGEDVPFGDETSVAISLSNAIDMHLSPTGPNFEGTGAHTITVTSTDVIGYDLYVNATGSTAMSNGTDTVAASANVAPGTLTANSWGYNTSGSTANFRGITGTQVLIGSGTGPFKAGDHTTITYGATVDMTKSSGTYGVDVTYTVIGRT